MKQRILVTGGSGFIGSNLISKLFEQFSDNVEIINLDKQSYAANETFNQIFASTFSYQLEPIDLCKKNEVSKIIETFLPHKIFHLAAETHVDNSIHDPGVFVQSNILGTFFLLESVRKNLHNLPQDFIFHHISTDEVFGDLEIDEPSFNENSRYKPSSPYSASKASSDHLVKAWHRTYNFPSVITNCSNNYGPNQNKEKFIPTIISKVRDGQDIPVYGNGLQIRDWLYVEDHVEALVKVAHKARPGTYFNIGGGAEVQNIEVVKLICKLLDEALGIKNSFDLVKYVDDRPGHDKRYSIDNSKIKSALGWSPRYDLIDGLNKTIEWYLDNG